MQKTEVKPIVLTDLDLGSATLVDNVEGPVQFVSLDYVISELPANKTLGIEYCVGWVHGDLKSNG